MLFHVVHLNPDRSQGWVKMILDVESLMKEEEGKKGS